MIFTVGTALFLFFVQLAILSTVLAMCSRNGKRQQQLRRPPNQPNRYVAPRPQQQQPHYPVQAPPVDRSEKSTRTAQPFVPKTVVQPRVIVQRKENELSSKNAAVQSARESLKDPRITSKPVMNVSSVKEQANMPKPSPVERTQGSQSCPVDVPATPVTPKSPAEFDRKPLKMEPAVLRWKPDGGIQSVTIRNSSQDRHAVKVKCSDNQLYRVNPVYSFIEPGQTLEVDVLRQSGSAKVDKMVFVTARADQDDSSPYALFDSDAPSASMVLPLIAQTA